MAPDLVVADVIYRSLARAIIKVSCCVVWIMSEMIFTSHVTQGRPMLYPWP